MPNSSNKNHIIVTAIFVSFITSSLVGFFAGGAAYQLSNNLRGMDGINRLLESPNKKAREDTQTQSNSILAYQDSIVKSVKKASPSVVSIIVTKDLPVLERRYSDPFGDFFNSPFSFRIPQYRQKGTEKRQIGGGTGFVVDKTGYIVTNKHVVADKEAEYTVLTNDGEKIKASVLARHPARDLAILKVDKQLPALDLSDSGKLKLGQTVIAIGNALGEFKNTVSTGVVSGLGREVTARGSAGVEKLNQLIQTDAAINQGNSGGPLLNIKGEVVGINTAMAQTAENIGFAIPINHIKQSINQVKKEGKITIPFLGVRYVTINKLMAKENDLPVDYGALIVSSDSPGQIAIVPGSPADKAGLKENDIVLSIDGEKITSDNNLANIIITKEVGQEVKIEYYHKGETKTTTVKLAER